MQAGAFKSAELASAFRNVLIKGLAGSLRNEISVVRNSGMHVVCAGSGLDYGSAKRALKDIKNFSNDAFIKGVPQQDVKPAPQLYAIQLGAFESQEDAENAFIILIGSLDSSLKKDLRVIGIGKRLLIWSGSFDSSSSAYGLLPTARKTVNDAFVASIRNTGQYSTVMVYDGNNSATNNGMINAAAPDVKPKAVAENISIEDVRRNDVSGAARPFEKQQHIERPSEISKKMNALYKQGRAKDASALIENAVREWPGNPSLNAWYGTSMASQRRYDKAYEYFRKASEIAPTVPEYKSAMGYTLAHMHIDSARRSISAFNSALEADGNNVNALEGLGVIYASTGQRLLAYDIYKRLLERDGNAAERLYALIESGIEWAANDK